MTRGAAAVVVPPATLGVLGGGQLGRYFVLAARTMGYRTVVLDPDPGAPAGAVADSHLIHSYDDLDALADMAEQCAVVTTEFENPPAATMEWLAQHTTVRPHATAVAITQDRRAEKRFLEAAGIPIAPWATVEDHGDLAAAAAIGHPAILKTARFGYDGKGQRAVDHAGDLEAAWSDLGRPPCVVERRLGLDAELSVVLARSVGGDIAAYPVATNTHVDGILDSTVVPAEAPGAVELASRIATALDYVGVLAVEMFVVAGRLLVNELAPRPHNSGHWTLDGAHTDQFQQQVRAVCGAALGSTTLHAPAAAMVNLLGDLWAAGEPVWAAALARPDVALHLYGKRDPRPGRKMGHLTVVGTSAEAALTTARSVRAALTTR